MSLSVNRIPLWLEAPSYATGTALVPNSRSQPLVDHLGRRHLAERPLADRAVVGKPFNLEQTAVGVKADLPQGGEILEPLADTEVPGIVVIVVSVSTRVRKRPGALRVTRRPKMSWT